MYNYLLIFAIYTNNILLKFILSHWKVVVVPYTPKYAAASYHKI